MKTYKETRNAVKNLVLEGGIYNAEKNFTNLVDQGHNVTNIQNAICYFKYSPQTAKYR